MGSTVTRLEKISSLLSGSTWVKSFPTSSQPSMLSSGNSPLKLERRENSCWQLSKPRKKMRLIGRLWQCLWLSERSKKVRLREYPQRCMYNSDVTQAILLCSQVSSTIWWRPRCICSCSTMTENIRLYVVQRSWQTVLDKGNTNWNLGLFFGAIRHARTIESEKVIFKRCTIIART